MKNTEETKEVPDVDEIVREELRNEFLFTVSYSHRAHAYPKKSIFPKKRIPEKVDLPKNSNLRKSRFPQKFYYQKIYHDYP